MGAVRSLHPVSLAVYYAALLLLVMFAAVPSLSVIALLCGLCLSALLQPPTHPLREYGGPALLFVAVTLTNPLFSHKGMTVLFFLNNNPVTGEALLYGAHLGCMLAAVIVWLRCLSATLTEDKLLDLLGGVSPKTALLLSMALRMIPLLKARATALREAETASGRGGGEALTDKLRATAARYSALVSWSLESAVDTGAVMKARGYGLPGRGRFSQHTFRRRDAVWLTVTVLSAAAVAAALATETLSFSFYPSLYSAPLGGAKAAALGAFALLCALPLILEIKEVIAWKFSLSRM